MLQRFFGQTDIQSQLSFSEIQDELAILANLPNFRAKLGNLPNLPNSVKIKALLVFFFISF